jgi:hypothetical protein
MFGKLNQFHNKTEASSNQFQLKSKIETTQANKEKVSIVPFNNNKFRANNKV